MMSIGTICMADEELLDLGKDDLIEALRNMPCCTTDKKIRGHGAILSTLL